VSPDRRLLLRAGLWAATALPAPCLALMAGRAPDTPTDRVDANSVESSWTSAVSVIVNGGAYSGVVVAPGHVLTAAHVTGAALPAAVQVQVNATAAPELIAASAISIFPGASFPYDDLALITLAQPVPDTVEIVPIYLQLPPVRQVVSLVGHGWSGQGDIGPSVAKSAAVKRLGLNAIDAVQTTVDASGRSSLFYLFDFDGPSGVGALGGATLGNSLETGLASGDSGSPVFATIAGKRWLLGINNLTSPAPGGTAVDFRFGTLGGGILLSDPRFIGWLTTQTQGTLGQPSGSVGQVPLPLWALGGLGLLLSRAALRSRG
jgi:Trypsin-like peptidase domain